MYSSLAGMYTVRNINFTWSGNVFFVGHSILVLSVCLVTMANISNLVWKMFSSRTHMTHICRRKVRPVWKNLLRHCLRYLSARAVRLAHLFSSAVKIKFCITILNVYWGWGSSHGSRGNISFVLLFPLFPQLTFLCSLCMI